MERSTPPSRPRLSLEERETLIRWSAADKAVIIDTADASVIRKLDRLCKKYPDVYACTRTDDVYKAKRYSLTDWKYISFSFPRSAAQIEAARKGAFKPRKAAALADNLQA